MTIALFSVLRCYALMRQQTRGIINENKSNGLQEVKWKGVEDIVRKTGGFFELNH